MNKDPVWAGKRTIVLPMANTYASFQALSLLLFLTLMLKIFTDRLVSELSTKFLNQVIASTKAFLNLTPDNNLHVVSFFVMSPFISYIT